MYTKATAPKVGATIIKALEAGQILTYADMMNMTCATSADRILRFLRADGYPIEERKRKNRIRPGWIKEFFYSAETLKRIRAEKKAASGKVDSLPEPTLF